MRKSNQWKYVTIVMSISDKRLLEAYHTLKAKQLNVSKKELPRHMLIEMMIKNDTSIDVNESDLNLY